MTDKPKEKTPFEKFRELAQVVVNVPLKEIPKSNKKRKHKRQKKPR